MNNEFLFDVGSIQGDLNVDTVPNIAVDHASKGVCTRVPLCGIASDQVVVCPRLNSCRLDAWVGVCSDEVLRKDETVIRFGSVLPLEMRHRGTGALGLPGRFDA